MTNYPPRTITDESKSREQLIRELKDLRARLKAEEEHRLLLSSGTSSIASKIAPDLPVKTHRTLRTNAASLESELLQNEKRISAVLEQLPEGVCLLNHEGRIIFGNTESRSFLSELMPSIDPDRRHRWRAFDDEGRLLPPTQWPGARALRGEDVPGIDFIYTDDDGHEHWKLVSAAPFRGEDNQGTEAIVVIKDITERKRAEESLRRVAQFPEENPCPVLRIAANGTVMYANEAARECMGLMGGTIVVLPEVLKEIVTKVHQEAQTAETEVTLPDGRTISYFAVKPPSEEYVNIYGTDISEQKRFYRALHESEERWNLALENIEAGVIIATEEAQVLYWNPAARKLHGLSSPDEGFNPLEETFDLWTPDRRHKLELDERPIRRLKRGETVHGYELRLHRPDQGWERYISYSGSIVEIAEGEKLIFLTLYDLTELRSRTEELVAVNRELESFSYSVSHDLRAPLRAISGFSSLLRLHAGQLDDKANEYLQRIDAGIKKMDLLIDDILRLSRISRQELDIQEMDLSSMAKAVVSELELQHPERHVELHIASDLKARGDTQLVNIALINLFKNAWKFTGKAAEASIEFDSFRKDGKQVFFIRDNGAGFRME